ncbi:MAG: transcription termination/antitermination NusG family protein, partial [Anaerolineales bacterium]
MESRMEGARTEGEPDAPAPELAEAEATPAEVESVDSGSEGAAEPEAESEEMVAAEAGEASVLTAPEPTAQGSEGAPEAPPIPGAAEDERKWYVVHCYSGYENKVRHNLEQRIESMGMK